MGVDIGPKIGIDGEAEFRKALQEIATQAKTLGAEMKAVTSAFDKNDKSQAALSAKAGVLAKQIQAQKDKLELQKKALEESRQKFGDADAATQKWQKIVYESTATLNKMERELAETEDGMKDTADATEDAGKSFDNAGTNAATFGDVLKANLLSNAIMQGFKMLKDAIGGVANAAKDAVWDAATFADEMATLSVETGLSTDQLQEYQYMAELMDTSVDTITGSMAKLTKNMSTASKGTGDASDAFKALGITVTNSDGSLRSNQDVFYETIDALGQMENETQRDAYAMAIFGKSAQDLNPMIAAGSEGMAGFAQEARDMGYVLDEDAMGGLLGVSDSMERLKNMADSVKRNLSSALAPVISEVAGQLQEWAESVDWDAVGQKASEALNGIASSAKEVAGYIVDFFTFVSENKDAIIAAIAGIGAGFVAWNVVTLIQGVANAIKAFKVANEGATVAQLILNAAMSANPIGIIVTAIAGLVAAITVLWNTNEDFRNFVTEVWEGIKAAVLDAILGVLGWMQDMGNSFVELKDSFVSAAQALADGAVSKFNDLKSKAVSSFNGLKTSVSTIVSGMKTAVVNTVTNIKNNAVSIFAGMKASISSTVTGIKTAIVHGFEKAVSYITSLPGKAVGWGRDFVNGLRRGIENAISGLIRSVKGIANRIRGFLHFSRPDFGPLRDYESWMPDFVGGLARGIDANAWRLEDAVERMAGRAAINMDGAPAGASGYNLGGVSIVVNAARGQDEEAIANKVMRKMQNLYDSKRRVYR